MHCKISSYPDSGQGNHPHHLARLVKSMIPGREVVTSPSVALLNVANQAWWLLRNISFSEMRFDRSVTVEWERYALLIQSVELHVVKQARGQYVLSLLQQSSRQTRSIFAGWRTNDELYLPRAAEPGWA
jgi:hypothetical protein